MDAATRMYRIRKTCLEMLHDRDYVISEVRATSPVHAIIQHAIITVFIYSRLNPQQSTYLYRRKKKPKTVEKLSSLNLAVPPTMMI